MIGYDNRLDDKGYEKVTVISFAFRDPFLYYQAQEALLPEPMEKSPQPLLIYGLIAMLIAGCAGKESEPRNSIPHERNREATPASSIPSFSGKRAYENLLRTVSFGPRDPNSPGHRECLSYLVTTLRGLTDSVGVQEFTHRGYDGEILYLTNIIAAFKPEAAERILLCTHWDTRPRAERDRDFTRHDEPILGANDGGSGVAILLEIAKLLKSVPPAVGVDIVLFDGEDYGFEGDIPNYLLGSRHFALTKPSSYVPRFGILLDMVGDSQLEILKEGHSLQYAPDIVDLVWTTAAQLGYSQFVDQRGEPITDDHLPLNEVGIRTADLIDFAYPDESHIYWHTHEDTPDKCSAESLEAVGTVITHIVYTQQP